MRKSMVILLLAWWLVAPAWGAELPREVRDALPAAAEEITEELEDPASLSEGLSRLWDRALGYVEEAVRQSIGGGVVLLAAAVLCALTEECMDAAGGKVHFVPMAGALAITLAAAADAMLPGRRLAGISRAIRKGTVWLLTGALALFTLYLTVSGAAAGSADTVTARLARSAVGVLPVVGNILADAADSVLAGAGAVKNTVGAAGLLAVLAVCLLPLVRLGVQYLVYKAAAFLAGILGAEQLTGLIDALGGAFGLIFGMTGACGLLLLISISSALGVVTG